MKTSVGFCYCLSLLIGAQPASARQSDPWADSVVLFQPGSGQNAGQDSAWFPANVLGPPDSTAAPQKPSSSPEEILSLGMGGFIVLGFTDNIIVDGPGPDFTVFENAFIRQFGPASGLPYAEPAEVSVSKDGVNFIAFPWDSLSLSGFAGVTPTSGHADPTDPDSSGGDSFDLASIGLDSVRFVALRDRTSIILDNREHPYWDVTLTGFDLDAIVAVNSIPAHQTTGIRQRDSRSVPVSVYPNPLHQSMSGTLRIATSQKNIDSITLVAITGQRVFFRQNSHNQRLSFFEIDTRGLATGVYVLQVQTAMGLASKKITILP